MRGIVAFIVALSLAAPAWAGHNEPVANAPDCQGPGQHWSYAAATGVLTCVTLWSTAQQLTRGAAANFYAIAGMRSPRDQLYHR